MASALERLENYLPDDGPQANAIVRIVDLDLALMVVRALISYRDTPDDHGDSEESGARWMAACEALAALTAEDEK